MDTDRPTNIVSQANADIYRTDTWSGTFKSMATNNASERRAVYHKRAIQSSDIATIYLPIDRDRDEVLPIYLTIRGTTDIWDVFKDVNFLLNYGTGSTLNLTNYTARLNQLYLDVVDAMTAVPNHPLVITSHSLGCKYALDIWKFLFNDPTYANRLHKNVMFNPFLIIDDDFSLLSTYPPLFKNTIETHIIDGDIASVVYKNHPINPTGMTIYANIVDRDEDGWINTLYDSTYAASLDVRNHQLSAFTDEVTQYPIATDIAYQANPSARRIKSVRVYNMTAERPDGSDQPYTNQPLYIEYDSNQSEYLGNNPVMESTNMEYYDLEFSLGDKRDMIYRHGQWSYPIYLDNTYTREWYLFRTGYETSTDGMAYYLAFGAQPNYLVYVRTYSDIDYTNRLSRQEHNLEKAYETITESTLYTVQSNDPTFPSGAVHLRTQWFISLPPLEGVEPHDGYGTGERRTLAALPILNDDYSIFETYATAEYTIEPVNAVGRTLQAFTNDGIGSYVFKDADGNPVYNGIGMLPSLYPSESPANEWKLVGLEILYTNTVDNVIDYILADIVSTDSTAFSLSTDLGSWTQNFNTFTPIISTFSGITGNKVKLIPVLYTDPSIGVVGTVQPDTYYIQSGQGYLLYHDLTAFGSEGMDPALWKEGVAYPITDDGYKWKFII